MKVTVYGGGNIGTQLATHFAETGNEVIMFTSKPQKFRKHLTVVDHEGNILHEGNLSLATNDAEKAFKSTELILVTVPSFAMEKAAKTIFPFVKSGVMIGIIPGNGGGEAAFKLAIEKGAIIFGLQRVPSVARLVEYGQSVCATGYRKTLYVAALPKKFTQQCCKIIADGLQMECEQLPDYLNLTITPSNPILHTTRLKTVFKDYVPRKTFYKSVPLFYEEWSDETTELLFKCDAEVQNLCRVLKDFDLSEVKSLKEHYENDMVQGFTNKIRSIEGFKGLPTPTVRVEQGLIPDLDSRYFTADFNFGLFVIMQVANLAGYDMPNCQSLLNWYKPLQKKQYGEFNYKHYGIDSKESFESFYKQ
ncbi:NAD/NADP octopine/nopaline dehydrogenase family protein [Lactobacillus delbrueckii subsp. lactis]|uniref:NAD/NADP octopine/nopaline dehydrogenase family protein n=1 Tax=Lactobacillus delbrueckii TaxID=1584 RepID=UPI001E438FB3|nr:NAD/NADP-dependent octopine/nopaline dehydrogenase family protein [Lactobacillus delbrueckii]MCD5598270.1 NAD/NADP octopine/nopaline dehydrogenase family protein [Lactobacillus delbrueckii subsp. lactis]